MLYDPHAIQILTAGSCYKNPGGLSGCAAIVVYPDDSKPEEQIVDIGVHRIALSRHRNSWTSSPNEELMSLTELNLNDSPRAKEHQPL
jgi:ribonuclease HI